MLASVSKMFLVLCCNPPPKFISLETLLMPGKFSSYEIEDVRIMGGESYLVARTPETLLLGDLQR